MDITLVIEEFYDDEILFQEKIPNIPYYKDHSFISLDGEKYQLHDIKHAISKELYVVHLIVIKQK